MTRRAEPSWAGRLAEANFSSFHQPEGQNGKIFKENRRFVRFMHEEPVVLETPNGERVGAVVLNCSRGGLYFESNLPIDEGAIVRIRNESAPIGADDSGCRAEVRWSRLLKGEGIAYRFGTGARYC